jgi:hypothetical protein
MKNLFLASLLLACATPWFSQAQTPAAMTADLAATKPSVDNSFNPALSLILSGGYNHISLNPQGNQTSGFAGPNQARSGLSRGFNLSESELGLSANIDTWSRGQAHIAFAPDNTISIEEAFVQTTSLGHGLSVKAGRFFSDLGYLNAQHAHSWDFIDAPLAYQTLLDTQYGDDGVQLRWLAPTDQFIALGIELGRGRSFPGGDNDTNGLGMAAVTAHTGGDWGASHHWRAGLSLLHAKAADQALATQNNMGAPIDQVFSGKTRVWVLDGVWKWAPNGNASQTSFKLQGEYVRSTRSGDLGSDVTGANVTEAYRNTQSGWYVQGVYKFLPRWRIALRTERLNSGQSNLTQSLVHLNTHPSKHSLMFDFNPSEFSRMRLQVASDRSRQGAADKQIGLQYQMSLGAHGAHSY